MLLMIIRTATIEDFEELYRLGLQTKEFRVSANESFMDEDEFRARIMSGEDIFLVAEVGPKLVGFALFGFHDKDRLLKNRYACLVYLVVEIEYRRKGIAGKLYEEGIVRLKEKGITHVYSWANAQSDNSMINFLKKRKYKLGQQYVWMDKKI